MGMAGGPAGEGSAPPRTSGGLWPGYAAGVAPAGCRLDLHRVCYGAQRVEGEVYDDVDLLARVQEHVAALEGPVAIGQTGHGRILPVEEEPGDLERSRA